MNRSPAWLLRHPVRALRAARLRLLPGLLRLLLRPNRRGHALVRLGSLKGGWVVPASSLDGGRVFYCFGLGTDASFELSVAGRGGAEIHTFDPTPAAIAYAADALADAEGVAFHPIGLWSEDGPQRFFVPRDPAHVSHSLVNLQATDDYFVAECRRLGTIMRDLGHDYVDVLKMDIEGAELAVLDDLLASSIRPGVVCVEFDQPNPVRSMLRRLRALGRAGYELVAVDRWNYTLLREGPAT